MNLLFLLPCLVAAPVAAGFLYQFAGARSDRRRHAGPGRCVSIGNGRKLYVLEKGVGSPAVVFESGIAATNLNWRFIQETVSDFAHTASYDRTGLGWSSPCRTARTPGNIARELQAMLRQAGIEPPYILVGHSFGGLVMRRYALAYPEDVAGVVLVDPMRIEEWPPLDPTKQATLDRGKKMARYAIPIARLGLARLAVTSLLCRSGKLSRWLANRAGNWGRQVLSRISEEVGKMPQEVRPSVAAHWSRPGFYAGMYSHMKSVPETVREMQAAGSIHETPVMVLTPGRATELTAQELRQIGDNVHQVIAPASAHWIHLDEPGLVIDAIRDMVNAVSREPVGTVG